MLFPGAPLLLLLSAALAASSPPRLVWKDQLMRPSSPQAQRLARTALRSPAAHQGSPSALRELGLVSKAAFKVIPGLGRKYFLQFTTKDIQSKQNLGTCSTTLFYMKKKPQPDVHILCSNRKGSLEQFQDDLNLYSSLRGVRHPSLNQVWALVRLGSSYIEWEKSTEDSDYFLKDAKIVKLQERDDDEFLELYFTVVLGNDGFEPPSSCHVHLLWKLGSPVKVKYDCSSEDESSGSADGSGDDGELASGFLIDLDNNF